MVVVGCGRIAFDATTPPGDGSGSDGPTIDADPASVLAGCQLRYTMDTPWPVMGVPDLCGGDSFGSATGSATHVSDTERGAVAAFAGGPSCVVTPDAPGLRGGSALTMSAWIRPRVLSPDGFGIISKRTDYAVDTAYSMFLWADSNGTGTVNLFYVDIDTENNRFE